VASRDVPGLRAVRRVVTIVRHLADFEYVGAAEMTTDDSESSVATRLASFEAARPKLIASRITQREARSHREIPAWTKVVDVIDGRGVIGALAARGAHPSTVGVSSILHAGRSDPEGERVTDATPRTPVNKRRRPQATPDTSSRRPRLVRRMPSALEIDVDHVAFVPHAPHLQADRCRPGL